MATVIFVLCNESNALKIKDASSYFFLLSRKCIDVFKSIEYLWYNIHNLVNKVSNKDNSSRSYNHNDHKAVVLFH